MSRALVTAAGALLAAGLITSALAASGADAVDAVIRPGDDFYRYANGPWLAATALPEGRASLDTTALLRAETAARVRALVEAAAASGEPSLVGDYDAAWVDTAAIDARGAAPLAADLASIAAIRDRRGLAAYIGARLALDDGSSSTTDSLFGVWIHQGFHDGRRYAVHLTQGGLGLGDRDAYLDPAADKAAARERYRAHIAAILALAGFDEADLRAARVLALETAIARVHASRADTDDVFKTDNPWRGADFAAKAPGLDWAALLAAAGLGKQDRFVVWQPAAIAGSAALVGSEPLDAWKDYLAFHLARHYAPVLPRAFRDEDAGFRQAGAGDRAGEAIAATNAVLGAEVGRLYVARYFPPAAKAAANAMAANLRAAFRARLRKLTWMSPGARRTALAKLASLDLGLGYPDRWPSSSGLVIRRGDAYGNLRRAEAFARRRELAKLARPVDPGEWTALLPQQVGAVIYFSPNTLQFSAGILQPPYFDPAGDAAANYGSAGAGMAHEIGHIFDELGALYDPEGRLGGWWSHNDHAQYRAATTPLAAQLAAYCPEPGLCLNAQQVLGESIGDLTGLLVAHDAYVLSLGGRPDAVKDGLTGEQRFFLAFARRWRRVQTDAFLRHQIASDSHAPGEYRADIVRNSGDWAAAFGVEPGDRLWLAPESRVRIW